jgi:hypothetical protein
MRGGKSRHPGLVPRAIAEGARAGEQNQRADQGRHGAGEDADLGFRA